MLSIETSCRERRTCILSRRPRGRRVLSRTQRERRRTVVFYACSITACPIMFLSFAMTVIGSGISAAPLEDVHVYVIRKNGKWSFIVKRYQLTFFFFQYNVSIRFSQFLKALLFTILEISNLLWYFAACDCCRFFSTY